MFFGKPQHEELTANALSAYANSLFDKKSSKVNDRCSSNIARAESALARFESACTELGSVEVDPDPEYVGMMSIGTVKEQKARYVKVLLNAIDSLKEEIASTKMDTEYETILSKKRLFENFSEHALKANASFRSVFMGYGNYFDGIKRSFKDLENSLNMLKLDIDRGTDDFSNYETLIGAVEKLDSMRREYSVDSNADNVQQASHESVDSEDETIGMESKKQALSNEISSIDAKMHQITSSINALLKPIERAARKYDHESKSKFKLVEAIENPMNVLNEMSTYVQFSSMLKDMLKSVGSMETDEKELELVKSRIGVVLNSNIFDSVLEASKLSEQKAQLLSELDTYTHMLAMLGKARESKEEASRAKKRADDNRKKLGSDINSLVHAIEGLFYSYYNVHVTVIL